MRITESGGAYRVVIPAEIAKRLKLKDRDRLVFISVDGSIIIKKIDSLTLEELKDNAILLALKLINEIVETEEKIRETINETIRGKIEENEYENTVESLKKKAKIKYEILQKMAKEYETLEKSLGRELSFAYLDDLDKVFTAISMEREREKEENFRALLEELRKIKEEEEKIRENLKLLEEGFEKGRISEGYYEEWKEKYLGDLTLVGERLSKVKKIFYS